MFEDILRTAGFEAKKLRYDAKHWQWWLAEYQGPIRSTSEDFVYFDRGARWRDVDAAAQYFGFGHGDVLLTVLVSNGAYTLARDLLKVKSKLRVESASTVPQFLCSAVAGRLGRMALQESSDTENFVEPSIQYPSDKNHEPGVDRLVRWFREFRTGEPTVGVLLAHGGTGKSTLARALFESVARPQDRSAIPLLVRQEQWLGLLSRPWSNLSEVWKEALVEWFPGTVFGPDQLEVFLSQGAVFPIFDGFDELCTVVPEVSATDTIEEMLTMFSEGRILLTSRRRFWEENIPPALRKQVLEIDLFPFTSKQRNSYLQKRFPKEPQKQRSAQAILDRISTKTLPSRRRAEGDGDGVEFERLDHLPLVVMLIAESADTEEETLSDDYGALLDDADPLRGVLRAFCDRERVRQDLTLTASEQLAVLEMLAAEFKGDFQDEDVWLALSLAKEDLSQGEHSRFLEHTLLRREQGRTFFRFPFVEDYLVAGVIERELRKEDPGGALAKGLERCASGLGSTLDLSADLLIAKHGRSVDEHASFVRSVLKSNSISAAGRAGAVHLAVRLAKRLAQGPRRDATVKLVELTQADSGDLTLTSVPFSGTVAQIDFTDMRLRGCTFSDSEWVDCDFDQGTIFDRCRFEGKLAIGDCRGLDLAIFRNCDFRSASAKSAIQAARNEQSSGIVTIEQIEDAIADVVRRFRRGLGFRTRKKEGVRNSTIKAFPFGDLLLDAMERSEVIATTGARDEYYEIVDKRGAHNLSENHLFIGAVRTARESLANKLDAVV